MVDIIGTRANGSLLGEEDGVLMVGTKNRISWSNIEREIVVGDTSQQILFKYGDIVVAKAECALETDPGEYHQQAQYGMYINEEGIPQAYEVTIEVVEWAEL